MDILERILNLRLERNWTEYRLSEESGIAQTTISSWYSKSITPTIPSLVNICNAFNITLSEFFALDDSPVVLTDRQKEIVNAFNKLNDQQQMLIIELVKSMNEN